MDAAEQYAALERFAQDPDLAELEWTLSEFNLFRLLSLDGYEGTHSTVLAWLLNPRESHRLGDAFLRGFLSATTALELSGADLAAARVQREWYNNVDGQTGYLDILILDEERRFLCAIENKVWSWEHSGQLTRYRRALETDYPDFTRFYLFLSPGGVSAYDVAEREHWKEVDYGVVCQLVEEAAQNPSDSINEDVRAFLRQYSGVLRRYILGDTSVRDLARKIYAEHSGAVELIYQHKPDHQMEVKAILSEVIQRQEGWELVRVMLSQRNRHRFFPVEWSEFEVFHTGKAWGRCKAMMLFEFFTLPSSLELVLCLGSSENAVVREAVDARIRAFDGVTNWTQEYHPNRTYLGCDIARGILDASDFEQWDEEAVRAKIEAYVSDFAQNQYPKIRDAVTQCFREFEASSQT